MISAEDSSAARSPLFAGVAKLATRLKFISA